jgi:predicted Zn-dependent peptidase
MNRKPMRIAALSFVMLLSVSAATAFDFSLFEKKVAEYNLDNGLKIIVLPRHDAPVATFVTMVNAGGVDDPKGACGIAHLFEHMAFKGTKEIGGIDLKKENKWMDEEDRIFASIKEEKSRGLLADTAKLSNLEKQLQEAMDSAAQFVAVNEFGQIVEREGGVGLNAGTSYDVTMYYINYPANRLELWMAMESDRFINPVLRELYKEKQVIAEERRMSRESSPQGKLQEEFLSAAFIAHPYHNSLIGPMSDIQNYDRKTAIDFFKKYYVPSNMTIIIVGDVNPDEVLVLAKKYFGRIPAAPKPEPMMTVEPPQKSERRIILREKAQPMYICGFHIPQESHPDKPALDALAEYLGQGRTSLLYKSLVKEKKIAVQSMAFAGFPGGKYPSLFVIFSIPSKDHTNAENEAEIETLIERAKTELISNEEMKKIKARVKANLINNLSSNQGLAMQLGMAQVLMGDWRRAFHELERIEAVTPEDIRRVANQYLDLNARTAAMLEPLED